MAAERLICLHFAEAERANVIAQKLAGPEFSTSICQSSEELYKLANSSPISAIVIEQNLCGFFSGLDLLARLEDDLMRPAMIVIGDLEPEDKQKATQLRINAIVPAAAPEETILAAVRAALEQPTSAGPSITPAARMLVKDNDCVRPLPQLVVRIVAYLNDPDASVGDLARELSTDARITADLLKLVNSAAFGMSSKVSRIQDAVSMVGIKRTISLVISAHLLQSGGKSKTALPQGVEQRLRLRSVLTAAAASTYASMIGQKSADMAYILALLQDLGILVLCLRLGKAYVPIYERCCHVSQLKLNVCEKDQLGFTHGDVTAALLEKWELPPVFVKLALEHHKAVAPHQGIPAENELLEAMQFGEALADLREQTSGGRTLQFQRQVEKWGHMDAAGLRVCLMKSIERTQELGQLFNVQMPDPAQMRRLIGELAAEAEVEVPAEYRTGNRGPRAESPVAAG